MHLRGIWISTITEEKMVMIFSTTKNMVYCIKLSHSEWNRFQKDNQIKFNGEWVFDYNGEKNGGSLFLDFYGCKLKEEENVYTAESWERKPYVEGELGLN